MWILETCMPKDLVSVYYYCIWLCLLVQGVLCLLFIVRVPFFFSQEYKSPLCESHTYVITATHLLKLLHLMFYSTTPNWTSQESFLEIGELTLTHLTLPVQVSKFTSHWVQCNTQLSEFDGMLSQLNIPSNLQFIITTYTKRKLISLTCDIKDRYHLFKHHFEKLCNTIY